MNTERRKRISEISGKFEVDNMMNCTDCSWRGDAKDLEVNEETDHEIWTVFRCPNCDYELGRENKHAL